MATHRYISTTFWDDAWIQELNPDEKFVYLYLMTNPLTSISGVYKITDRRISFDTGHDPEKIKTILEKFGMARKAIRMGEYIVLPSWPKHQNWESIQTIKRGIINELTQLNDSELRFVYECGYKFPMEDILKKRGIMVEKTENDLPSGYPIDTLPIGHTGSIDTVDIQSGYPMDTSGAILFNSISFNKDLIGNSIADPKSHDCENLVDNFPGERPPPNPFILIKEKVKAVGFYIDDPVIKRIAKSIPNAEWFTGQHTIIDFVAEKVADIYADKPKEERKKLFISALTKWGNLKDEYPDWLKARIKADEIRALDKLRKTQPEICPQCGIKTEGRSCPSCRGFYEFNEKEKKWKFIDGGPPISMGGLAENFMENQNKTSGENQSEDIDF